ncbi:MAG: L,D-transpeptidase [Chloroflexi bacterium]|nr:L,D-transpeptidase [Chloroflexota bacterium]
MNPAASLAVPRRRLLQLTGLALVASALDLRPALAAGDQWYQNFKETDLWSAAKGGKIVDHAPQWTYLKAIGPREGARVPVEHPRTKQKVYVPAGAIGPSGPPPADWAFGGPTATPAPSATPAPAPAPAAAPAVATPAPAASPAPSSWLATFKPSQLWTAAAGGVLLGEADVGSFFQLLELQKSSRLHVQDPITSGSVWLDATTVGPVGGPPTGPRVPARWWGSVGGDDINVRVAPTGDSDRLGTLARGTPVVVEAWVSGQEVFPDQPGWAQLGDGVYVYSPLLRKAPIELPPDPPDHGPLGSKWIDVNLTQQTVTAYEADRPVYMAFTSSGRPEWETHEGIHRILWRKENETMESSSLLGQDAARADYKVENVRWTQYFTNDGQALHENYWRDPALFGIPSSHGCLGVGSQDAAWFWLWASTGTPLSVHY